MLSKGNYEELITIKKNLAIIKRKRKNLLQELRGKQEYSKILQLDLQDKYLNYKKGLETKLKNERHMMNIDKELREQEGFTNQKPWEQEVRKRTQKDEEVIIKKIHDYKAKGDKEIQIIESQIQSKRDDILDLDLEIDDVTWDLKIKLEAYKEYQIVQVV